MIVASVKAGCGGLGREWRSWLTAAPALARSPTSMPASPRRKSSPIPAMPVTAARARSRRRPPASCANTIRPARKRRPRWRLIWPPWVATRRRSSSGASRCWARARSRRRASRSRPAKPRPPLNGTGKRAATADSRRPAESFEADEIARRLVHGRSSRPRRRRLLRVVPGVFRLRGIAQIRLFGSVFRGRSGVFFARLAARFGGLRLEERLGLGQRLRPLLFLLVAPRP